MKLKVNNVHKFYGTNEARIEVLKGINCEVLDGEICVLLGPSGSGKSTLLNIIGGLESADEGCIDIGDFCPDALMPAPADPFFLTVFHLYILLPDPGIYPHHVLLSQFRRHSSVPLHTW